MIFPPFASSTKVYAAPSVDYAGQQTTISLSVAIADVFFAAERCFLHIAVALRDSILQTYSQYTMLFFHTIIFVVLSIFHFPFLFANCIISTPYPAQQSRHGLTLHHQESIATKAIRKVHSAVGQHEHLLHELRRWWIRESSFAGLFFFTKSRTACISFSVSVIQLFQHDGFIAIRTIRRKSRFPSGVAYAFTCRKLHQFRYGGKLEYASGKAFCQ